MDRHRNNRQMNFWRDLRHHLQPVEYWYERLRWAEENLRNYRGNNLRDRILLELEVRNAIRSLQSAVNRIARETNLPPWNGKQGRMDTMDSESELSKDKPTDHGEDQQNELHYTTHAFGLGITLGWCHKH